MLEGEADAVAGAADGAGTAAGAAGGIGGDGDTVGAADGVADGGDAAVVVGDAAGAAGVGDAFSSLACGEIRSRTKDFTDEIAVSTRWIAAFWEYP